MKPINYCIILISIIQKIYGIELPVNSSDRTTISNWVIAKTDEPSSQNISLLKENPKDFFQNLSKDKIREIYLSNYNDVTISLYQLYNEIDFKTQLEK